MQALRPCATCGARRPIRFTADRGHFLRHEDKAHLAELHPAEFQALRRVAGFATLHQQDGFAMAQAVCPPDSAPRPAADRPQL